MADILELKKDVEKKLDDMFFTWNDVWGTWHGTFPGQVNNIVVTVDLEIVEKHFGKQGRVILSYGYDLDKTKEFSVMDFTDFLENVDGFDVETIERPVTWKHDWTPLTN